MKKLLLLILVAGVAARAQTAATPALPAAAATGPDRTAQLRYDAALEAYEVGHFELAFAAFAALADEGHCGAARVARDMARHGKPLYAMDFKVAPERLQLWDRLPSCARVTAAR